MKLWMKFLISFFLVACLVIVLGNANIHLMRIVTERFERVTEVETPSLIALGQIKALSLRLLRTSYNTMLSQPIAISSPYMMDLVETVKADVAESQQFEDQLEVWVSRYAELAHKECCEEHVKYLRNLQKNFVSIREYLKSFAEGGMRKDQFKILEALIEETDWILRDVVDKAIEIEEGELAQGREQAYRTVRKARRLNIVLSICAFCAAIALGLALTYVVVHPIVIIKNFAKLVGDGDLNSSIEIKQTDELGELSSSLNQMVSNLRKNIATKNSLSKAIKKRIQVEKGLVAAKEEAERASEEKNKFLGTMSHQLRDPLNALIGFLPLLQKTGLSDDQKKCVDVISQSADELFHNLKDLLDFTKIEADELYLEQLDFNVRRLCKDVVAHYVRQIEGEKVALDFTVAEDVPTVITSDPKRLAQILENLIANAIDATEEGTVSLAVTKEGSAEDGTVVLCFRVTDTGRGISEEQKQHIAELDKHADTLYAKAHGGIGIGIIWGLAKLLGGKMTIASKEGSGSRVSVTIKAVLSEREVIEAIVPVPQDTLRSYTVAVVSHDDQASADILYACKEYGVRLLVFGSEEKAADYFSAKDAMKDFPHVIVLDLVHSLTDKEDLDAALKELDPQRTYQYWVLSSSQSSQKDVADAEKRGFHAYLSYHDIPTQFIHMLRYVLGDSRVEKKIITKELVTNLSISGVSVLLADGHDVERELLAIMLKNFGCKVDAVSNGTAAIDHCTKSTYDIAVMAVDLPIVDGIGVLAEIRKGKGKDMPVIALSQTSLRKEIEHLLAVGFNDYLSKPVDSQILKKKILMSFQNAPRG